MQLRKIRVQGFQSFSDSGEVEFEHGFNLIIGQNNAGKSAFLRSALTWLPDERHTTPERWDSSKLPPPCVTLSIEAPGNEIYNWALQANAQKLFPVPPDRAQAAKSFIEEFFKLPSVTFTFSRTHNGISQPSYPSHRQFIYKDVDQKFCAEIIFENGELKTPNQAHKNNGDTIINICWDGWNRHMFYFAAERLSIGEAPSGHAIKLLPNASNLPNVLHTLQNEKGNVFKKLVGHLRVIFPSVGNLSVRSRPDNHQFEIRVWPTTEMQSVELSFPLNSSGTGVAQAIAILTAIMTVENTVMIIDEINSFLHPAAVKALLRILQTEYPHHQYIISTHSPEVIGFSNPKTIHLVKREGYESTIEKLNLEKLSELRGVAEHLGVSMADVFAAERVIWVEGPTEELIFPYLYSRFSDQPIPRGTIITSVAATGDFNRKRDRDIIFEVYKRLSSATSTLVVAAMFSFDTEELTEDEKDEMQKNAGGSLSFLPRRHIECYLLDPVAITNMIVAKDPSSAEVATSDSVLKKLTELAGAPKFLKSEWTGDITNEKWLAKVDAAKLIAQATADIAEQRATFHKKRDSLTLVQDIFGRNREQLKPLFEYVESLVKSVSTHGH